MKCRKETDYRTVDPSAVYELKKVALRLRRKGKEVKEICETTGLADKTVRMTFHAYDAGGIDAIKPKKRGRRIGDKRTLSVEQEQEIIAMLVDRDPAQLKLKGCMWTRDSVKELIKQKYGITMPNRTVGEYLHRWGFTVQRPAKREANQKAEQVEVWLNEEYPAIHRKAKAENAGIFWETLIKTSNGRKVYFILDNLKVHHSKLVSQWVDAHKDEIALFHLPPYSPEYNPDEYLNNDLKQSIGTQAMAQDIQELEANTSAFMGRLSDDPDHVKAYFDHPALTKYKLN